MRMRLAHAIQLHPAWRPCPACWPLWRAAWVLVVAIVWAAQPGELPAQGLGAIAGQVVDAASRAPIGGARLQLVSSDGRVAAHSSTDPAGRFVLTSVASGQYRLEAARIGYAPASTMLAVEAGRTIEVEIALAARAVALDAEVVTASRREEKVLEAPASVSVIGQEAVAAQPALTVADRVATLAGVDVVSSGLTQHNVVTRGFNNAGSGQLLVLTDNRYAAVPSLRINAYNFIPLTDFDLERIEVVRGPGAALYGPNTTAGVLHLITRSPFDSRGTTLGIAAGERSLVQVTARHAGVLGESVGLKLSGQYFRAQDFGFVDPEEQAGREAALRAGADPDTLRIGRRDSLIERLAGEARLDLKAGQRTTLIAAAGFNQALNNVDITGFGAAQVRNWRYQYAQVRLIQPDFFAQAFYNGSDAGDTYQLRTGQPVVDRSRQVAAQVQRVLRPGPREMVTLGADLQRTDPRTEGTIYGRYEQDDATDEAGAYVHSETRLAWMDLVAALRLDYHSRVPGVVLSPRAAAVLRAGSGHTVRLTYNRAFSTPTSNDLFLDLLVDSLRDPGTGIAIPFAVRVQGVPKSGLSFARTCGGLLGGLCMRSPFASPALGGPTQYLPADATLLWSVVVDSLRRRGVDLSGIPAPTASEVGSALGRLDAASRSFVPVLPSDVADLAPLGHRTTNTIELGYKGALSGSLLAAVDLYYSWYHGFTSEYVATPNVFFEKNSLAAYLARYLPAAQAGQIAGVLSQIPVGTISPEQAFDPTGILVTFRNFGRVSLAGLDAAATWMLTAALSLEGSYSWVSRNWFTRVSGIGDLALNAPRHKGALTLRYAASPGGLAARAAVRYVGSFPVKSGIFAGQVNRYAVLDADIGFPAPRLPQARLSLSGSNLLQAAPDAFGAGFGLRSRHREFVRVPEMGRVVVARLEWQF